MKSIILCEGMSDLTLLQYYLEKMYQWNYSGTSSRLKNFDYVKQFSKENASLEIASCGGSLKIMARFMELLLMEKNSKKSSECMNRFVIVSDHDDDQILPFFMNRIQQSFEEFEMLGELKNHEWSNIFFKNEFGEEKCFEILLLLIPFQEQGALETFLLNAIAKEDKLEEHVIKQCNVFVDTIDTGGKYVVKRRDKVKAKFDVYFCIRTPIEQFKERHNILKNIPWEQYLYVQETFKKLEMLSISTSLTSQEKM